MKLFKSFLVFFLVLGLFAGCEKKPVAKLGGELVIYSPNSAGLVDNIIPAFEEKYGVTVHLVSAGTGECLAKIDAEKENPQADILYGGMNLGVLKQYPDLWEEYVSPNDKLIDEAYRNKTGFFTNYCLDGSGIFIINNKLAKELGLDGKIKGYNDLLNPALKGKISYGDPTASSSAWAELSNMLAVMGDEPYDEKAWAWVEKFVENLGGIQIGSSSAVWKGVVEGEYVVGVSYEDPCVQALQDGADVTLVYPEEGAVWLPAGTAIIKNAKNMAQAKAFIDFIISEEGQKLQAKTTVRGTNTKIPPENPFVQSFSNLKIIVEDIEFVASKKTEWQARYAQIRDNLASKK